MQVVAWKRTGKREECRWNEQCSESPADFPLFTCSGQTFLRGKCDHMTHIPFQKNSFPISNEEDVCVVFCFGLCGPKTNALYQRERKAEQVLLDVVL